MKSNSKLSNFYWSFYREKKIEQELINDDLKFRDQRK